MIQIRKAQDRGYAERSWLKSWHTFSFADYFDPEFVHFGPLRVINEDIIAAAGGFPTHPHQDMEIVTYLLEGALEHKDSMGNGSVIRPGEVQRMSAGTGVTHSEFNHSDESIAHLLQIWFLPDRRGHAPSYEQIRFAEVEKRGRLRLVASADGRDGSVSLNQDVRMYAGLFDAQEAASYSLENGRMAWLQLARGTLELNGVGMSVGDGAAVSFGSSLKIDNARDAELILFDVEAD